MLIEEKYQKLQVILKNMGKVLVAYSGGVDSVFLLKIAHDVLKENVHAVLGLSAAFPSREYTTSLDLAKKIGVDVQILKTEETDDLKFKENPINRCYFCKTELFKKLQQIAAEKEIIFVVDGTNLDDVGDFRPGMLALKEQKVKSPLKDAGFRKSEIRELSKKLGLPTWRKPAMPCLSSRFPYGQSIDEKSLNMVDNAENILRDEGFYDVRVRHHDKTAKIEVIQNELNYFLDEEKRRRIVSQFKDLGYKYVTLDLEGLRSGSLNEILTKDDMAQIKTQT